MKPVHPHILVLSEMEEEATNIVYVAASNFELNKILEHTLHSLENNKLSHRSAISDLSRIILFMHQNKFCSPVRDYIFLHFAVPFNKIEELTIQLHNDLMVALWNFQARVDSMSGMKHIISSTKICLTLPLLHQKWRSKR